MDTQELELAPANSPDVSTLARADSPAIWKSYAQQLSEMEGQSTAIVVTDATQVSVMKSAATMRKTVKAFRCEVENKRKELVAGLNKATEAINSEARGIRVRCEAIESRLEEQEQFALRAEAEQKRILTEERSAVLHGLGVNPSNFNLGGMKEEEFSGIVAGFKADQERKLTAAKQAEDDRIAKEKADAEERERQRVENERLKKEAAEREAELKSEREKAAKERAAAEERARVELEAARKREAQLAEASRREREIAEAKARKARKEREEERAKRDADIARLEKAAAKEREKLAAENAAAKQKAEEQAKAEREAARKEREKAEAAARVEREARQKAEAAAMDLLNAAEVAFAAFDGIYDGAPDGQNMSWMVEPMELLRSAIAKAKSI